MYSFLTASSGLAADRFFIFNNSVRFKNAPVQALTKKNLLIKI
jgi:hypothetical protein